MVTNRDFTIEIEDRWAADFWFEEWTQRFRDTKDHAFKEQADAMARYIGDNFQDDDEDF